LKSKKKLRQLEQFFLTVDQNNFGNKLSLLILRGVCIEMFFKELFVHICMKWAIGGLHLAILHIWTDQPFLSWQIF
jgi:hypothetical protein